MYVPTLFIFYLKSKKEQAQYTSILVKCMQKTCFCPLVHHFGTLFWDDITKIWDKNLLLFTFLTGKLRKKPVLDQ